MSFILFLFFILFGLFGLVITYSVVDSIFVFVYYRLISHTIVIGKADRFKFVENVGKFIFVSDHQSFFFDKHLMYFFRVSGV